MINLAALTLLAASVATPAPARQIDVCFVLDTTGSMSALIQTAKDRIWYLARKIATLPGTPDVRVCLMAFRDRGDAYVTKHLILNRDMDHIYAELKALVADGGGDTPEAVNQALLETVQRSEWRSDPNTLKIIFLFGDAPPHTDYDEPQFDEIAAMAARLGILINPVLVGQDNQTKAAWKQLAQQANGTYSAIDQHATTAKVQTYVDQDIAVLGARLDELAIPYGDASIQERAANKAQDLAKLDDATKADRTGFWLAQKHSGLATDLIDYLDSGTMAFSEINAQWLPESLRELPETSLQEHLQQNREQRSELRSVIRELASERETLVEQQLDDESFEKVILRILEQQFKTSLEADA